MSDGLPPGLPPGLAGDESLRRIEQGVRRRIARRHRIAQQVAGVSVAVVLLAGGIALVRPIGGVGVAGSAGGGSMAGPSAERAADPSVDPSAARAADPSVTVVCHGATIRTVEADREGLPASAFAACAASLGPAATADRPASITGQDAPQTPVQTPVPSPSPSAVLCESPSGVLHVTLGTPQRCAAEAAAAQP